MSEEIYVVQDYDYRPPLRWDGRHRFGLVGYSNVVLRDPNGRDGEWHAVIKLPHEIAEWEGYGVPVFEGDVERREWEGRHRR